MWGTDSEGYPEWKPVIREDEGVIRFLQMYENCRNWNEVEVFQLDNGISGADFLKSNNPK